MKQRKLRAPRHLAVRLPSSPVRHLAEDGAVAMPIAPEVLKAEAAVLAEGKDRSHHQEWGFAPNPTVD